MRYKIEFTEKALNMLKVHIQYLSIFDVTNAKKFKEKIYTAIKTLEVFPNRYPVLMFSNDINEYRKLIIDKKNILIYQVIENKIYIKYFLDCKQDYKWLL